MTGIGGTPREHGGRRQTDPCVNCRMSRVHRRSLAHHVASLAALDAALAVWERHQRQWAVAPAAGTWSAQDETAHLLRAMQYGVHALTSGDVMPIERPAWVTGVLQRIVLPLILASGRFPRGGRAPAALDLGHPSTIALRFATPLEARDAAHRLGSEVEQAFTTALRRGGPPVTHAYFGPMPPALAWRVLSAHTTHHAQSLNRRAAVLAVRR